MNDFSQDNQSGGERDSQKYGGGGSARPMYKATCAECGSDCEVPFQPSGDRPVYCSNCFGKRSGGGGNSRRPDRRNDRRPRFEERRTPLAGTGNASAQLSGQIVEQLGSLNAKLDKIIGILEPKVVEPQVVEAKTKKTKASKKKAGEKKAEVK